VKAIFDTINNKLIINGRHNGNRRMWTIVLHATTQISTERMVFSTDEPCLVSELADVVSEQLRPLHNTEGGLIRVRWEAMAR
jgi:hypothetical protein